ncbi:galactofuranose ABC transporter, permease protein YjfF [Rhodanobacter terrae]|uniref:Galactofuranose ABC transporter, permease protein YjfF n=1 Tax=Rhodanobacter terrae TaxID=418647 RepID=A0ABW0SWQ8_9GAMM
MNAAVRLQPQTTPARGTRRRRWLPGPQQAPMAASVTVLVAMSVAGGLLFPGFLSPQVFLNLLVDNAVMCVVAVGMSFVILSGGIDLSVGALVALTTVVSAVLVEHHGWSPWLVMPLVLALGIGFGIFMGLLIQCFGLPPFVVTLGGMFLARGLAYVISVDSVSITQPTYEAVAQWRLPLGGGVSLSAGAVIALLTVAAGMLLARATAFGRAVYAIGGSEGSAYLMGLRVGSVRVRVYALSGFCSALGGIVLTFYMLSGYSLHAQGMELDAIAAVVIGGTLLTGGQGSIAGTFVGVLILGLIQTLIVFDGSLSSWWTKIALGVLLFAFCLLQRLIVRSRDGQESVS